MKVSEIKVSYTSGIIYNKDLQITSSSSCYDFLKELFDKDALEYQEFFYALYLNRTNQPLGYKLISKGGSAGTVVEPKQIFSVGVKCNASSIILAHNHPSGNPQPSTSDIELTKRLQKGGEVLGIDILDHFIITKDGYYSFADEGLIN